MSKKKTLPYEYPDSPAATSCTTADFAVAGKVLAGQHIQSSRNVRWGKLTQLRRLATALLLVASLASPVSAGVLAKGPSTADSFEIDTSSGTYLVYTSNRCETGACTYLVSPRVYLKGNNALTPEVTLNVYSSFVTVGFVVLLVYPDMREATAQVHERYPKLPPGPATQLRFVDLYVSHPAFAETSLLDGHAASNGQLAVSNQGVPILLRSLPGMAADARRFAAALRKGSEYVYLRGVVNEGDTRTRVAEASCSDLASTRAVRDFLQASEGQKVNASQLVKLSTEITRECFSQLYDEFEDGDETQFLGIASSIASQLFALATATFVDVKDLHKELTSWRRDPSDPAYQPDVITKFVIDQTNNDNTAIKTRHRNEFEQWLKTSHQLDIDGRLKGGIPGIFGLGTSYAQKSGGSHDDGVKSKNEIDDEFKHSFDRSFHIEWEGKRIKRLSVRLYEDLNADIVRRITLRHEDHRVRFDRRFVPLTVDPSIPALDLSLPGRVNQWPN